MQNTVEKEQGLSKGTEPVKITKTLLNQYRDSLLSRACKQQTINMYLCYLNQLYAFLPEDKELTNERLRQWVEDLRGKGYSDRTINFHISSVNGLLRYCGRKKAPASVISTPKDADLPELNRDEYLKLISYVKKIGSERDYLLIKVLASVDINVIDLPLLSVDACREGVVEFPDNRKAYIPGSLQKELLSYIDKKKISSGSVFKTSRGNDLDRSNITHMVERLGKEAGINPEKCNPRALRRLYQRTQEKIDKDLLSLRMQAYDVLLNAEENRVS